MLLWLDCAIYNNHDVYSGTSRAFAEAFYKYFILMLLALELHWHCQWNLINRGKCSKFPKANKQKPKPNSKIKSLRIVRATMNLLMKQTSTDWRALLSLPPGSKGSKPTGRAHLVVSLKPWAITTVSPKCSALGQCVVLPWSLNSLTGRGVHRSSEIQRWLSCKKSKRCCCTGALLLLFI